MTEPSRYPGAPRWVRALGFVGLALVVLGVVAHLTGHGPGRHFGTGHVGHMAPRESPR